MEYYPYKTPSKNAVGKGDIEKWITCIEGEIIFELVLPSHQPIMSLI